MVATTEEAARDVQAFVTMFFEAFKEFEGRPFHMAGESYGGRYLPVFASTVIDGNKALKAAGKAPINLQSVMIGNGITDFFRTMDSYYPYQCTIQGGLNQTVQSIGECVEMAENLPKCDRLARRGCLESKDFTECAIAIQFCETILGSSFIRAGVNPYDVSKPCTLKELEETLCYSVTDRIADYLDLPDVREKLGVESDAPGWASCDNGVGMRFGLSLDTVGKTWLHVIGLVERGVRVLNYAGTYDFICNHIGNEMWMESLEWTGKHGFNKAELADWKVDGKVAGSYKTYKNLSVGSNGIARQS